MNFYKTKSALLPGSSYQQVAPIARKILRTIEKRTKRQPYIRSAYFKKDKIFFTNFWDHLLQKSWLDRARRLRYLPAALELIRHSQNKPNITENPNRKGELFYRFFGITDDGYRFCVQIKEAKRKGRKELMSIFPHT